MTELTVPTMGAGDVPATPKGRLLETIDRLAATAPEDPYAWIQASRQAGRREDTDEILRAAETRFPGHPDLMHDLARAAEQSGDWPRAEHYWRAYLAQQPDQAWAQGALARALWERGLQQEADSVLADAMARFPDSADLCIERARLAERRRDWADAGTWWQRVATDFPERWEGAAGCARAEREQGRLDACHALLIRGLEDYPEVSHFLVELARTQEVRRNWRAAERWWRLCAKVEPAVWWSHAGLAEALLNQGDAKRAATVMESALGQFQAEPWLHISYARLAEREGDWAQAAERWRVVAERFPGHIDGFTGLARALRGRGAEAAAEAALRQAIEAHPGIAEPWYELAHAAEARRDWQAAESLWRGAIANAGPTWRAMVGLARCLGERGAFDEARKQLVETIDRYAGDQEAMASALYQASLPSINLPAETLGTAEARLAPAVADGSASAFAAIAHALAARMRLDWVEYNGRLRQASRRYPESSHIKLLMNEAAELVLGTPDTAELPEEPGPPAEADDVGLVSMFESLGAGRGATNGASGEGGCEFGFFQRMVGAEPLSLLRWATIEPDMLLLGLRERFERIDDPQYFVLEPQSTYDWRLRITCYGIQVDHTHLDRNRIDHDEALQMVRKRFGYLRRKLVEDLADGRKYFVYRLADGSLDRAGIDALAAEVRAYGPGTLVFVEHDLTMPEDFKILEIRDGLVIARLRPLGPDQGIINVPGWLGMCRAVHATVKPRQAS